MHISRAIYSAAVLSAIVLAGCHSQTSQPSSNGDSASGIRREPASPVAPAAPAQAAPTQSEASPTAGSAEALAQRAQTYAQSMSPKFEKPQKPEPKSSWPDPEALHLTPQSELEATAPNLRPQPATAAKNTQANASVSVPVSQHLVTSDASHPSAPVSPAADGDALETKFASRAKDYPADLSAQVDYQLLKFLKDEPVPDMTSLSGLAPEDRELLSATMDSLTNFRNQLRQDNNMLFSKKIRPLVELGDRLRSQAELSVPTVALCTAVKAFGVYEPIEPARFIAGKDNRVVVYCEVENFLSQPNDKGLYETRLSQDIVLYTEASGLPAWSDKKSAYVDQSRRRRHDFFMGKIITLPANLTIGRYLLKVSVEDQQARHIAENTVPVEIVAQ